MDMGILDEGMDGGIDGTGVGMGNRREDPIDPVWINGKNTFELTCTNRQQKFDQIELNDVQRCKNL